jgi:hypothetical protein
MYFASAFQLSSYALLLQSIHSEIPKFKLLLLTNGIHFIKNTIKRWINIEKDECNTVNQKIDGLPDNCINKKSNGGYCFKNKKWFTRSNVLDNKKIGHTGNGSPVPNEINKRKKNWVSGTSGASLQMQLVRSSAGQPGWLQPSSSARAARCGTQSSPPPTPAPARVWGPVIR